MRPVATNNSSTAAGPSGGCGRRAGLVIIAAVGMLVLGMLAGGAQPIPEPSPDTTLRPAPTAPDSDFSEAPTTKPAPTLKVDRLAAKPTPTAAPPSRIDLATLRRRASSATSPIPFTVRRAARGGKEPQPVPGGRVVGRIPGFGTLLESPVSAPCQGLAQALGIDGVDQPGSNDGIDELEAVVNGSAPGATQRLKAVGAEAAWPWAWNVSSPKVDMRQLCGTSAMHRAPGDRGILHPRNAKPTKFGWQIQPRVRPRSRRHWVLEDVTHAQRGRLFVSGDAIRAVESACGGASDDNNNNATAVCENVLIRRRAGVAGATGVEVHFGGYAPFGNGQWPRLLFDAVLLEPEESTEPATPTRTLRLDQAVWVPPADMMFSYHFVVEFLVPLLHASMALPPPVGTKPPAFLMAPPSWTRWGYKANSCAHGAAACLDKDFMSTHGKPERIEPGFTRPEWIRLFLFMAGGRERVVGLDAADRDATRVVVTKQLVVGAPTTCETTQGRSGAALFLHHHQRRRGNAAYLSDANAGCGQLWREWRLLIERFLDAERRLPKSFAAAAAAVTALEPPHVVYLTRGKSGIRKLIDEEDMVASLRNLISNNNGSNAMPAGATVVVSRVSSLAETYAAFRRATIVILTHGAATVNTPLLRENAGFVVIDSEAPPLLPIVPPWVHTEAVMAECKAVGQFRCGDSSSFHDLRLGRRGIADVTAKVADIIRRQRLLPAADGAERVPAVEQ